MSKRNSLLIVLLIVITLTYSQDPKPLGEYTFEQFEQQFGRKYTGQQRQQHRKAFNKNYQELLNAKKKSGGDFDVQVNDFMDMTQDQKGQFLSYKPKQLNLPTDNLPKLNKLRSIALPQSLNYTAQGKVTSVKNQGKCGACWAFTTAALYQSQLLLKGLQEHDLSEQYLIQCTDGATCSGGWPATALNFFTEKGIPEQTQYPYKANDTYYPTDQICSVDQFVKAPYDVDSIKHYSSVPDSQLKQILLDSGPVSVGVKGSNNGFLFYSGGVFSGCDDTTYDYQVNHVLLLVGWTKQGHWIVKNSWGKGWGDKGYAIINVNKNCGITHFIDALTLKNVRNDIKTTGQSDVQPNQMENLRIKMTDSYGDGWNGYVMGIRQGNSIVTVFGEQFKAGTDQGPVEVQIKSGEQTNVVVAVVGKNSQEIGFSIIDSQGNQVCSRVPGSKFIDTIIFCTFCPGCETSDQVSYQLLLTDTVGDGWNGNVLTFKQDGVQTSFGEQFINGNQYGPRTVQFTKNIVVQISPYLIGKKTQEVGFELRDSFGNIVFKREPGTAFAADAKLGEFCPACENLYVMNYQVSGDARQSYVVTENYVSLKPYIIAVSVLSAAVLILIGVIIYLVARKRRVDFMISKRDSMASIPPGGSILVSTATIPDEIQSSGTIPSSQQFKLN